MEMLAFKSVFSSAKPIFSIKGGMGHSMAATGLIETILTTRAFDEGWVPPTARLAQVDEAAAGWVSSKAVGVDSEFALKTNAGFGGVNAALVVRKPEVIS